jgi:two-component system, NtrC family, response regulator HydG
MDEARPVRMLVVEDDAALLEVLCDELRARGHFVVAAQSVAAGLAELDAADFEVALLDLMLPDGSGIDILRRVVEQRLATEAIVLTGYASLETAVEAMKLGAYDYMTKPARLDELEVLVRKAAEKGYLRRENQALRMRVGRLDGASGVVTEDPAMRELLATVARVASSDLPVLIEGETGTGKELLARAIHTGSQRAAEPFVAVNCGAIAESLLESELFGYERGAFTGAMARKTGFFEAAHRGVLFLDEIGEVSPAVQVKLLRALEAREITRVGSTRPVRVDVRIVSATNRNVKDEMLAGRFREDLYFRLNGITLRLPPLRDRRGDVPLLARHFLDRFAPRKQLTAGAVAALAAYSWPGNVREMEMVVRRAALLSAAEAIGAEDLPADVRESGAADAGRGAMSLAEVERDHIESVLRQHGGHRGRAARALGIDPKTLYNKLGPERPRKKAREASGR